MTSLKTSFKTITYLSDIGCLEIQGGQSKFVVYDVIDRNMYLELLVVGFYRVFCSIS
ncbi:DNA methylase [Escherichia coli]|uniref:DNA methylase n=1 Tax=Escherichia coli TaxID=562 RepID=A0A376U7N9_ECOLX|nr:DNA methylase [Escherichia coli]